MNELQKELDQVYKLLGTIRVSGDDVEMLAAARVGLRRCFQMAQVPEETSEDNKEEAEREGKTA